MSRRTQTCKNCGEKPRQSGWSLCAECLDAQEMLEAKEAHDENNKFLEFMSLDEDDRWNRVFDFMRERGYEP